MLLLAKLKIPVCNEASKYFCCWFCKSGPISVNVKTDRRGYCPGEAILLNALFENNSSRSILPQASLYQCQTFNANGKHIIATNKLSTLSGQSISSKSSGEWNGKLLKIPAISPSISSALIRVEYFIKVSLLIPGSYSLSCILPIVIGTVPYRRNLCTSAVYHLMPSFVQNSSRLNDAPPAYSELAKYSGAGASNTKTPTLATSTDLEERLDDQIIRESNYCPLYTFVSEYIPPPPYSEFEFAGGSAKPNNRSNDLADYYELVKHQHHEQQHDSATSQLISSSSAIPTTSTTANTSSSLITQTSD